LDSEQSSVFLKLFIRIFVSAIRSNSMNAQMKRLVDKRLNDLQKHLANHLMQGDQLPNAIGVHQHSSTRSQFVTVPQPM
jgi:hypothetical protein